MPLRLLKTKSTIPFPLEHRLTTHWGYTIDKRVFNQGTENYILFRKSYVSDKKDDNDDGVKRTIRASVEDTNVVPFDLSTKDVGLSKYRRTQLENRCDNIVSFFPDPYNVPQAVRARLSIIQQTLLPDEVKFVQNYMDENFPQ